MKDILVFGILNFQNSPTLLMPHAQGMTNLMNDDSLENAAISLEVQLQIECEAIGSFLVCFFLD